MIENRLHDVINSEEMALHCWENEGGSLREGSHLRCNQHASATKAMNHGSQEHYPPKDVSFECQTANRPFAPRRSKPAHWRLTASNRSGSHRYAQRWLPRLREKRKSRHALERTPLGLLG